MKEITKDLYQLSMYIPPIDFTIHQYLLAKDPAVLFAAGTVQQAQEILPQVKEILDGRPLEYVFVSHLESDEAGGLSVLLAEWPELTVVCSGLAARELPGYGYAGAIRAERGGAELVDGELDLTFVDYPSEVHLQNGLLCLEKNSGILYSSDLFLRYGNAVGKTMDASWKDEVAAIGPDRVPVDGAREDLKARLQELSPKFVAVGHGYCINCA